MQATPGAKHKKDTNLFERFSYDFKLVEVNNFFSVPKYAVMFSHFLPMMARKKFGSKKMDEGHKNAFKYFLNILDGMGV